MSTDRYIKIVGAVILGDLKRKHLEKDVVEAAIDHIAEHFDEIWENINEQELLNSLF